MLDLTAPNQIHEGIREFERRQSGGFVAEEQQTCFVLGGSNPTAIADEGS